MSMISQKSLACCVVLIDWKATAERAKRLVVLVLVSVFVST